MQDSGLEPQQPGKAIISNRRTQTIGPKGFVSATIKPPEGSNVIPAYSIFKAMGGGCDNPTQTLDKIREKYRTRKDSSTPDINLALRRAAFKGNIKDIEELLEYGADPVATSSNGLNAFQWAYLNNQMAALTPLGWASRAAEAPVRKIVIKYVTKTESELPPKNVAIVRAAAAGNMDDIRALVTTYKASLSTTDAKGRYLGQIASANGHPYMVEALDDLYQEQKAAAEAKKTGNSSSKKLR